MITKRPERIADNIPTDWGKGWEYVIIAVTCENQEMADKRLPIYLSLPLYHQTGARLKKDRYSNNRNCYWTKRGTRDASG